MRPKEELRDIKRKADQNLQAATYCKDKNLYNSAISRIYYSILQKLIVVLMKEDNYNPNEDRPESHNYIRKRIFAIIKQQHISYSQILSDFDTVRRYRKTADYKTEFFDTDNELTDCWDINNKVDYHFKALLEV